MAKQKRALGRGLSALLEDSGTDVTSKAGLTGDMARTTGSIAAISVEQIEVNPFQPRSIFEKEALLELANSIKEHGIIQPVTVRKLGYDKYQLISGERRFRASQAAGLTEVPAYIRIANDEAMLEMALVENIQRKNLDAIEVAISYKRLMDECDLTQEVLAQKVSKSRSAVTNFLRLLKLPAEIQMAIREDKISMGHARALVSVNDSKTQISILKKILKDSLSVRQVEDLVRVLAEDKINPKTKAKGANVLSFEQQKMKQDLMDMFRTKVDVKRDAKGKGKIIINFDSDDDLDRISDMLSF
jgi:ParB family chromosome partitioning protein